MSTDSAVKSAQWFLKAQVTRWVSDDEPGIVECRFTDRFGKEWNVIEKVPVVSASDIRRDSQFPQPVTIGCEIVSRDLDGAGREIAEITTRVPWGVEATDGTTNFQVFEYQLTAADVPT